MKLPSKHYFYLFSFILLLLILILPLVSTTNTFDAYEFPKFIFFVVAVALFFLCFIFIWFPSKNKAKFFPRIDFGIFLVLAFGIVSLTSDLIGIDPARSLLGSYTRHQGFLTLASGMILFLILRSLSSIKKSGIIFRRIILVSAFTISLFAIWQLVQINMFHNYFIPTYNGRIVGTLGNPNFLGGYLAMLLPFVLWYTQKSNKLLNSFLIYAGKLLLVFVVLAAIFLTDSISSFIAVAFLLIVYFVDLFMKIPLPKIVTGLILILIFSIGSSIAVRFISNNFTSDQQFIVKDEKRCFENWPNSYPLKFITDIRKTSDVFFKRDSPCDSRFLIWIAGANALGKSPILGFGQDNFESAIPRGLMYIVDNAHNIFLETAISSGITGLLLYLTIIIYFLAKASFEIKLSIIAFLIVAQFNPLSIAQISLFWILLGFSQQKKYLKKLG